MIKNKVSQRNTNIEYVRLLAIFLIILNHYALLGGFYYADPLSFNAILIQFLHSGGKFGVNVFIFISGYFWYKSERVNVRHIAKFLLEVTFYSLIFAVIGFSFHTLSLKGIVKMLLPIPFVQWPFVTFYFMLMCLSFWFNKMMHNVTERQHRILMIGLGITWCICPTFFKVDFAVDIFGWYVYMFLLGGYLRRIIDDIKVPAKKLICFSAISYGMILLSELVIDYIGAHFIWSILKYAEHFRKINSFFIVFSVVTLVAGAAKLKPGYNRFVQTVASTTLGVFLIHDNKAMIPLLWRKLLRCYEFNSSKYLILHAFGSCIAVFVACVLLDLLRQKTVGKLEDRLLGSRIEALDEKINAYLSR